MCKNFNDHIWSPSKFLESPLAITTLISGLIFLLLPKEKSSNLDSPRTTGTHLNINTLQFVCLN